MNHELKIWPQYFSRVKDGSKTFEVRENDRGYQPGDTVFLREWDPALETHTEELPIGRVDKWTAPRGYTGHSLQFTIGYVLPIDSSRVVFSLLRAGP